MSILNKIRDSHEILRNLQRKEDKALLKFTKDRVIDPEASVAKPKRYRDYDHNSTSDFSEPSDSETSDQDKAEMTLQDKIKRSIIKGIPISKQEKEDIMQGKSKGSMMQGLQRKLSLSKSQLMTQG